MEPVLENLNKEEVDLSLVVTCYNEKDFIVRTLNDVLGVLKTCNFSYEIIVVDDASRDNSSAVITDFIKSNPQIPMRLVTNPKNRGVANIFVDNAFRARGKYYRVYYGDGSEHVETTAKILRHVGHADLVMPVQEQDVIIGKAKIRKILSKAVTFSVNFISGFNIGYYNGMPIVRRYLALRYPPITYGFGYQIDLVTRLLDEGVTYCQVRGIMATDRNSGQSVAVSWRNIFSVVHTFIEVFIRRVRRSRYRKDIPRAIEVPQLD